MFSIKIISAISSVSISKLLELKYFVKRAFGLPKGIAFYSLLQLAVSKWADLASASLILNLGNAWIYNDTTDRAKALLSAEISLPPEVFMKKVDPKKQIKADDFFVAEA